MLSHCCTQHRACCCRCTHKERRCTRKPCDPRHDDTLITVFLLPILSKGKKACVTACTPKTFVSKVALKFSTFLHQPIQAHEPQRTCVNRQADVKSSRSCHVCAKKLLGITPATYSQSSLGLQSVPQQQRHLITLTLPSWYDGI